MTRVRKALSTVEYAEMEGKIFTEIRVEEKLCEVCSKPLRTVEKKLKTVQISNYNDFSNLLTQKRAHDRVEVDLEVNKIYVYHHDYPGEVHPSCIEKL